MLKDNGSIIDALSELEMVLFYNRSDHELSPEVKELHQEAKAMLERWHFLTGETI